MGSFPNCERDRGNTSAPVLPLANECQGQLSHTRAIIEVAHSYLCCQDQFHCASRARHRVCSPQFCCWREMRDGTSSLGLTASNEGRRQLCTTRGHPHDSRDPWRLSGPRTAPCTPVVIGVMDINFDPCCCVVMDLDMTLSGSSGWDLTVAPGSGAGHSYQATTPLPHHVSSSITPQCSSCFTSLSLPSAHHILTRCTGSHCRLAIHLWAPRQHPPLC